jgi:eukaryotic-like serine/threonine-protein kinase
VQVLPPPPPRPVESPMTTTMRTSVVPPVPVPAPVEDDVEEERGSRPGLLIFLALLLLVVLGLAAYFLPKMFESPNNQVQVPRVIGMTVSKARTAIGDAKLAVPQPSYQHSATVPKNRVISQDPNPGEYVDQGSDVNLTVSLGAQSTEVPPLIGQTQAQAQAALTAAHLKGVFKQVKSDQPQGTVVSTDPVAGSPLPRGATVNVSISRGPSKIPNVVGLLQADAEQKLRDAGFVPSVKPDDTSTEPQGTVTQQVPDAHQTATQGSTVYIFVSSGPTEPTSPPTSGPTSPPTSLPTSPTTSASAKPSAPGGGPG